jgi:CheY-like chemotaxis protein
VIGDPEPPPKETVRIPWIPFVESYFARLRGLLLGAHAATQGPIVLDLLDPRGSSVYRYASDARFEAGLGDKAKMSHEAFFGGQRRLQERDLLKVTKSGDDASVLFCFLPGLRHYFYGVGGPGADIEALYRWVKGDLEQAMVEALHGSMVAADEKRGARARPIKVLVGESEDFLGNLVRIKLRSLGMDVHLARDGGNVLEVMPQLRPDVVLLDVNIRGVNGHDVCRTIAGKPELAAIPILLLVADASAEDLWPPGVVAALAKPVVLAEVVAHVRRYAGGARAGGGREAREVAPAPGSGARP